MKEVERVCDQIFQDMESDDEANSPHGMSPHRRLVSHIPSSLVSLLMAPFDAACCVKMVVLFVDACWDLCRASPTRSHRSGGDAHWQGGKGLQQSQRFERGVTPASLDPYAARTFASKKPVMPVKQPQAYGRHPSSSSPPAHTTLGILTRDLLSG